MRVLLSQLGWIASANILAAIARAVSFMLLARHVLPESLGRYAVVAGTLIILQSLADLGLSKLIVQQRAIGDPKKYVGRALRINEVTALLMGVIGVISCLLMGRFLHAEFTVLSILAVPAALEKTADTWLGVTLADNRGDINAKNLVGRRLIALGLFWTLLYTSDTAHALLFFASAELCAALASFYWARRHVKIGDRNMSVTSTEILREARPFWINTLASQLRNADMVIITSVSGSSQAGLYSIGSRILGPLQLIQNNLAKVLLPLASGQLSRRSSSNVNTVTFVLTLIMCTGIAALAPAWVPAVFGADYDAASFTVALLVLSVPWLGLCNLGLTLLQSWGEQRLAATYSLILNFGTLVLMLLLVPLHGATGAAIAVISSSVLMGGCMLVLIRLRSRSADERGRADG